MKPYSMLKTSILVCSFGGALMLSPTCKAQSEVAPDHFEGGNTEPWEKASRFAPPQSAKANPKQAASEGQTHKTSPGAKLQVAAARDHSKLAEHDVVAVQDKRKAATRKSTKQ